MEISSAGIGITNGRAVETIRLNLIDIKKISGNKIIYSDYRIVKFLIQSKKYGDKEVIIDIEDWDKIKKYKWYVRFDQSINNFYVVTNIYHPKHIQLSIHREIMNIKESKLQVDHINHNTLDNRKNNLRICSCLENVRNKRIYKINSSGYKGVCWHKRIGKWYTQIEVNKKNIYIGQFDDKIKAALAYNKAAKQYFGEFANLNIIEGRVV